MSIGVIGGLIFSVVLTIYVCSPLLFKTGITVSEGNNLELEKERLLLVLREIELDYKLGNISESEYTISTTEYKSELALVLKQIDKE